MTSGASDRTATTRSRRDGLPVGEAPLLNRRSQIWIGAAVLVCAAAAAGIYMSRGSNAIVRRPVGGARIIDVSTPEGTSDSYTRSLRNAKHSLEALVQAATRSDWEEVGNHVATFQEATRVLPSPELRHPDISMVLLDFFSLYQVQLERAIAREDRARVLFASNQLEGIIEDLIAQLSPGAPSELGRLRFLSRDINYWAGAGDQQMLHVRAAGLQRLWADLRPLIMDRNGRKAAENFDFVLLQLGTAEGPEDIQSLTPQLQDAVRQIEVVLAGK